MEKQDFLALAHTVTLFLEVNGTAVTYSNAQFQQDLSSSRFHSISSPNVSSTVSCDVYSGQFCGTTSLLFAGKQFLHFSSRKCAIKQGHHCEQIFNQQLNKYHLLRPYFPHMALTALTRYNTSHTKKFAEHIETDPSNG